MFYIIQSFGANRVPVGPFLSANDMTPLEALPIQTNVFYLSESTTGTFTPTSWGAGTGGNYSILLPTAITTTLGKLRISFSSPSTYLPVWEDYMVLTLAAWQAWFASGSGGTTTEHQRHGVVEIIKGVT